MITNVKKGWKTTLIGTVILLASIASVFVASSITWADAAIGITIGLTLIFCPDTILEKLSSSKKIN